MSRTRCTEPDCPCRAAGFGAEFIAMVHRTWQVQEILLLKKVVTSGMLPLDRQAP